MRTSLTLWMDTTTGQRLDRAAVESFRHKAHELFEANTQIFEDEADALTALGVVSILQLDAELAAA